MTNKKATKDYSDSVRYSRAGDLFHYGWAARKCIEMLYPNSDIEKISIEGSSRENQDKTGECAIDLVIYSKKCINYIQFKHSIKRLNKPIQLSELKKTFIGFASKYKNFSFKDKNIKFSIITNRKITDGLKNICNNKNIDKKTLTTLKKYTKLTNNKLLEFCKLLILDDTEKDYSVQLSIFSRKTSQIFIDKNFYIADKILTMIQEKVTDENNNVITKADIFDRLGIDSDTALFPAHTYFEEINNVIKREQQDSILKVISKSNNLTIIHASGGTGKSIFAQQIVRTLPEYSKHSISIIYDCFAGGKYRNITSYRHRYKHGLIQINNELALRNLCEPLINVHSIEIEDIAKAFNRNLKTASELICGIDPKAYIVIVIDAADNAKIAAKEHNDDCFIDYFIKEELPANVTVIFVSRTERINLLSDKTDKFTLIELKNFSIKETSKFLKKNFSNITEKQIEVFQKLTGNGNPRVLSKAILRGKDIHEVLNNLGPRSITAEKLIEQKVNEEIDKLENNWNKKIVEKLCISLATLPPFIPIKALSNISGIDENYIRSFISDLEIAFWTSSDNSIHFKDEPTETWFRNNYSKSNQINLLSEEILKLNTKDPYIAEIIPEILLKAGKHNKLIDLALDESFKLNNPIETRRIKISRLNFAFKAAIKNNLIEKSLKIAMLLGEELSGNERQYELLKNNIDIIEILCGKSKCQELAFRKTFKSQWNGSENLYTSVFLSYSNNKIEAEKYLQNTLDWLKLHFKDKKDSKSEITLNDITELSFIYLNLYGANSFINNILRWKPKTTSFYVVSSVLEKLIDCNKTNSINGIIKELVNTENTIDDIQYQYITIAIANELANIGHFIENKYLLEKCLSLLNNSNESIYLFNELKREDSLSAIISFLENCLNKKCNLKSIERILDKFFTLRANKHIVDNFNDKIRQFYFRALSIKEFLSSKEYDISDIMPQEFFVKQNEYHYEIDILKKLIKIFKPLYKLRLQFITNDFNKKISDIKNILKLTYNETNSFYGNNLYTFKKELFSTYFNIFTFYKKCNNKTLKYFFDDYISKENNLVPEKLYFLRSVCRNQFLKSIKNVLEKHISDFISLEISENECYSENIADLYIRISRALIPINKDDATVYFDKALNIVSKFSNELTIRWKAIEALGEVYGDNNPENNELSYRFIRCAEFIYNNFGDYIDICKALSICTNISPKTAISYLSRMRDRGRGIFHDQLKSLIFKLLSLNKIIASDSWATSTFFKDVPLNELLELCLEKESNNENKKLFFKDCIFKSEIDEVSFDTWNNIKQLSDKYYISDKHLNNIIKYYKQNVPNNIKQNQKKYIGKIPINFNKKISFRDLNDVITKHQKETHSYNNTVLIKKIIDKIPENNRLSFLKTIDNSKGIFIYTMIEILQIVLNSWKDSVSIMKHWNKLLEEFGKTFSFELIKLYDFKKYVTTILFKKDDIKFIQKGIIDGIKSNTDLFSADIYWEFVEKAASYINSKDLLNYSLNRIEQYIKKNYGDGLWTKELYPSGTVKETFIGLIWTILGAPESDMRWRAIHSVKKLADLDCKEEIRYLIEYLNNKQTYPFTHKKYPFYQLHAKLHLLIALSRISVDNPTILKDYLNTFITIALNKENPHVLIQEFAANISINILNKYPELDTNNSYKELCSVNKSPFPLQENLKVINNIPSYLYKKKDKDKNIKFYPGYDFKEYWLKSLGEIFGICQEEMLEFFRNVAVNNFELYDKDPRIFYFDKSYNQRTTYHSHGNYPKADNYSFYVSYHSMMMCAAMLLKTMPVLRSKYYTEEDPLQDWIYRYSLSRKDGRWLSDRRDVPPLHTNKENKNEQWIEKTEEKYFTNNLILKKGNELWLNIFGYIKEKNGNYCEDINFSSALVSKQTAKNLMIALDNCKNAYDFCLPHIGSEHEIDDNMFKLKGFVKRQDIDKNIDSLDPFYAGISYPTYEIDDNLLNKLKIKKDYEGRSWFNQKRNVVATCKTFASNYNIYENEDSYGNYYNGMILSISSTMLKKICIATNMDIIISVTIDRNIIGRSFIKNDEKTYTSPKQKIFIFSKDGKILSYERCSGVR